MPHAPHGVRVLLVGLHVPHRGVLHGLDRRVVVGVAVVPNEEARRGISEAPVLVLLLSDPLRTARQCSSCGSQRHASGVFDGNTHLLVVAAKCTDIVLYPF